jgi:plasmid rolling circle replication initiator protein Rep
MSDRDYTPEFGKTQVGWLVGKCNKKKLNNWRLLEYIVKHVADNKAVRIKFCGTWLAFLVSMNCLVVKLVSGNFCGDRFCPMCSWRKARKDAQKIAILMEYLRCKKGYEFIFLTLTAPNVKGERLSEETQRYNESFKKMMKRQEVEKVVKGYIRKLEVTYNKERDDFHPHFHVLLAVNKSYFKNRDYINHDRWLELWQEAMNDKTITQVDVRKVKRKAGKEVTEVAKYAAKDEDYLVSQEVFDIFYSVLRGRQIVTYSGDFAKAHKAFKNKDVEMEQFKHKDTTGYMYLLLYRWGHGAYVEAEKRELTEQEKVHIHGQLLEEIELDDE